jgi:hypothetical protein
VAAPRRIRIELDDDGARALRAALSTVLASGAVGDDEAAAARTVLEQLDRRVDKPADAAGTSIDAGALVDVIYAEHRPGRWAYRPAVQAIARLADAGFDVLAGELRTRGLLEPADGDDLALTDAGADLARERWAASSSLPHWRIPAPPLAYRELPVRVEPDDRCCGARGCDGEATWLRPKGRSAAFKALVKHGAVEWACPQCSRKWTIYLQAYNDDGAPAYRDPVEGTYNRPLWRRSR